MESAQAENEDKILKILTIDKETKFTHGYKLQNTIYDYILTQEHKKTNEMKYSINKIKVQFDPIGFIDITAGTESIMLRDGRPVVCGSIAENLSETVKNNIKELSKFLLLSCGIRISEEDFQFYE